MKVPPEVVEAIQGREAELLAEIERVNAGGEVEPGSPVIRELLATAEKAPASGGHGWSLGLEGIAPRVGLSVPAARRVLEAAGVPVAATRRGGFKLDTIRAEGALFSSAVDATERGAAMARKETAWELLTAEDLDELIKGSPRGYTTRLSELLDVSRPTVSNWRRGTNAPPMRDQRVLARLVAGETIQGIRDSRTKPEAEEPKPEAYDPFLAGYQEREPEGEDPEEEAEESHEDVERLDVAVHVGPVALAGAELLRATSLLVRAIAFRISSGVRIQN